MLWELEPHANASKIKEGMNSYIIFEEKYSIAYKFQTTIKNILTFHDKKLIKIPHSNNLISLTRRKYPRINVQIEAFIKREGKLRDNPNYVCTICNLSRDGMKICIDGNLFNKGDIVEIKYKLNNSNIEAKCTVLEQLFGREGEYRLQFTEIDPYMLFVNEKYIQSHMKDEII